LGQTNLILDIILWYENVENDICAILSIGDIMSGCFVVYLTTLFQYVRLVALMQVVSLLPLHNFYSILIRLPESSSREAGDIWVRNMAAEFCLQSICFMLVRFFYMP
jgi:hypothetical protein